MKKTITLLLTLLAFTVNAQSLILTKDTIIEHDENFLTVRTNGFDLTVKGSLVVTNFIMMNKGDNENGGKITAEDDIIISGNIYFLEDNGYIHSDTGISVGDEVIGVGTISYCNFLDIQSEICECTTIVQNCFLSLNNFNLKKIAEKINIGEPYIIYNTLGQVIKKDLFKGVLDIYTKDISFINFPRLGVRARTILEIKEQ
jgi:hypothetical protein